MLIGEQIKAARNRLGWNQDALGDKIHMSRQTISHWETGRAPVPTEYISILEDVLGCTFDIESEQEQLSDDQAEQTPVPQEISATTKKKSNLPALLQKNIPAWMCAAITGGVFVVMLVIMLCTTANLQKQINALMQSVITPYSLAWFQEPDVAEEGKAFIRISSDQNPVMAQPNPDGGDRNIWHYQLLFIEENGIPFKITELTTQPFNGDLPKSAIIENEEWLSTVWGDNNIPANGIQYLGSGMPVQAITHTGILIKGVDANGNELEFRGIVEFSQELAE